MFEGGDVDFYSKINAKRWQEESAMHSEWAIDYLLDGQFEEAIKHQNLSDECAYFARISMGLMDQKRKKGRPSTNFDKRAYQREYMRRRRAKAKAEKETRND